MSFKVSFVLPTRNVAKFIGPLLEAIYSQKYDGDIEVLIMDSSDDQTPEIVRKFPVKFVEVKADDYNYGKTRNQGVAMTSGDLVVFMSTDVGIKDKTWLTSLTHHFDDPRVAGVYGRQIPWENAPPVEQFFILYTYPARPVVYDLKEGKLKKGFFFSNVNSAIRRSVWEQIKLPEMIKGEDQEWGKRVLLAGYKIIYDNEAAVYHSHKYTLKAVFQNFFDSGAARPVLYQGTDYSMNSFVFDGLKYVWAEYRFMLQRGYWYCIPYAIVYDITKFLGVFLGSKQKYMPLWMKRALSKKKDHWAQYHDVIKEAV
jgi:rhamnosyltransferase